MFLAMYSANWVVSPDSPDTAITNLMSHMFDFTLNNFDCPKKAENAKPVWEVEELVLVALHHHDRPDQELPSHRIILSGCNNTWRWSDQRLPWRSRQTAFLSDTPSCSLKDPYFNFLKCVGQGSSQISLSSPQPMSTWTQIPLLLRQILLQILLCRDQAGQTCAT